MYLYFDKTGVLKEIINNEPFRVGNSYVNKLYVYVEDIFDDSVDDALWVRYKLPNGTVTAETVANLTVSEKISFNKKRDLKFFNYSKVYKFVVVEVPDEVLGESGTVACTLRLASYSSSLQLNYDQDDFTEETSTLELTETVSDYPLGSIAKVTNVTITGTGNLPVYQSSNIEDRELTLVLSKPADVASAFSVTVNTVYTTDSIMTLGLLTFMVEYSVEQEVGYLTYDGYVSLSQFNYLLKLIDNEVIDFNYIVTLSGNSGILDDKDFANLTSGKCLILKNDFAYYYRNKTTFQGATTWTFQYTDHFTTPNGTIIYNKQQISIHEDKTWSFNSLDFQGYTKDKIDSTFYDKDTIDTKLADIIEKSIIVIPDNSADISNYDEGQLFYSKDKQQIYQKSSGNLVYYDFVNYVVWVIGTSGTFNAEGLAKVKSGNYVIHSISDNKSYICDTGSLTYTTLIYKNISEVESSGVITTTVKTITIDSTSGNWTITSVDYITYNKDKIDSEIAAAISGLYTPKGSASVSELNTYGSTYGLSEKGYVYNVTDSGTLTAGSISVVAGDNVVWLGTEWDKLAGTIDLSGYLEKIKGLVILPTPPSSSDLNTYSEGQMFYIKSTMRIYELSSGSLVYKEFFNYVLIVSGTIGQFTGDNLDKVKTANYRILNLNDLCFYDPVSNPSGSMIYENVSKAVANGVITITVKRITVTSSTGAWTLTTDTYNAASVEGLENGQIVPLQAKNIAPISEESGATQETPFVYQGTGTANGTASVDTSPVGKQLEKQGNSVVVNQIMPNGTFTSPWSQQDASNSVSSNVCTATFNNNNGKLINNISNGIVGHTYLMTVDAKAVDVGSTVQVFMFIGSNYALVQKTGITSWTKLYCIQTVTELFSLPQVQLRNSTASSVSDTTVQFRNACLFDLTQWFGSNDNIPSDLLSHPENFFRYYNGSLAYNTGTLENANGRYLECGGRNVWDETFGSAYEGRYGSANLINVIPNTEYAIKCPYFYDIKAYDKDQNEIGYLNTTQLDTNVYKFKTSSNAKYIKFSVGGSYGTTYNHDITISLYYATGDGYSEYYPYETPKIYDTGVEVLGSVPIMTSPYGFIRDKKLPSGEITRYIGSYTFTSTDNWVAWGSGYRLEVLTGKEAVNVGSFGLMNMLSDTGLEVVGREYISNGSKTGISCAGVNIVVSSTTNLIGKTIYYELATPTTESGTPFAENIEINDYGTMGWKDTNSAYVSIPQGCKIFYPADYVLFIDSLGQYSDWTATKVIRTYETNAEKLVANPNVNDNWDTTPTLNSTKPVLSGGIYESDTILQNAIGGTLRHCLAIQEAGLNFEDTDFVDLGTLSWSSWNTHEVGHETWRTSNAIANIKTPADNNTKPKALCSLYVVDTVGNAYNHVSNLIVSITTDGKVNIYDSTHTDYANATAFKNAMKGVLLAYEKA